MSSSISLTLAANVENLSLSGTAAINATGNQQANTLLGNAAANVLTGGLGNDALTGGLGNDTYVFARGYGTDTVTDTDATAGNQDVLSFLAGVNHDQLWFKHVSNNLEVSVIGTSDKVVIKNWYVGGTSGTDNRVEQIRTAESVKNTLASANVEALVTAMAGLTPPASGQTSLSASQHAALDGVIAASWS
jgi:Ca2+-binding RTX toxin-like protein